MLFGGFKISEQWKVSYIFHFDILVLNAPITSVHLLFK